MIAKIKTIDKVPHLLSSRETVTLDAPAFVYLTLELPRAPKVELFVKEGDHVYFCQKIGVRHGSSFDLPIFSTVSGQVLGIEKHTSSSGKPANFLKVQNDFKDELDPEAKPRTAEEIATLTKEDVFNIVNDFGLTGLGGSGFPTIIKLKSSEKVDHILLNGVECEPYLNSDQKLMLNHAKEIIEGALILQKIYDCKDVRICVKGIHQDIVDHLNEVLAADYKDSGVTVALMKNFYPQGWEVAEIKTALNIEVASGKLPFAYGVLNLNVATAMSLYRAVALRLPMVERYATINGDGVAAPKDFLVRIGTLFTDVLPVVGGYTAEEGLRMSVGGPMMGSTVPNDDVVFSDLVTNVLVTKDHTVAESPCIRCGSCVLSCPTHLEPVLIMEAVKSNDRDRVKALKPLSCVECGLCTYVCTSGIRVTDYIRRAKILAKL